VPRLFLSRLLETFFRRPWLYVVPLVPFLGLGIATVTGTDASFRSTGVILVNRATLLSEINPIRGGQNSFGWDTPAAYTSRQINTVLGTDQFLGSVLTEAGLTGALTSGALSPLDVRNSVQARAEGDELVSISASTSDPELSFRLAQATIASYLQWEIDNNVSDSSSAQTFFESTLAPYEQRLEEARTSLERYVNANPFVGDPINRPVEQQVEITRLTEAVNEADRQLSTAKNQINAARQATAQSSTDVAQRLRIVDSPDQPSAPESRRMQDLQTLVMYIVLGTLVSAAALVVGTMMDRSVRYSEEIAQRVHVPVLATLPDSPELVTGGVR
jgi:uncharacterized protein involved in exopolysaccharide biosynthesis